MSSQSVSIVGFVDWCFIGWTKESSYSGTLNILSATFGKNVVAMASWSSANLGGPVRKPH